MNQRYPIDPFSLKRLAYWNPKRLIPTLLFRFHDWVARCRFESYSLPLVKPQLPDFGKQGSADTAVTTEQYSVLTECLRITEQLKHPCVEIGSFRGETTQFIAQRTARILFAVDPFAGWGGAEADLKEFLGKISGLPTVQHLRLTSGQAASEIPAASFVFIDAVHDYANVCFDLATYAPKIVPGGVVALHDTDNPRFAGVRRAVCEFASQGSGFSLVLHVHDLVVFQRH